MIGQTISRYRILEKIGEGGMGVVYKAEDTRLERIVALKFLSPRHLPDEETRKRFIREAKAAAALSHHNICTVYEIDEVAGHTFIAMAYIEGQSLDQRIEAGSLDLKLALDIARQVADGLHEAHGMQIVHRDIKPGNIMLTPKGEGRLRVTIMDFGLAQLAHHSKITRKETIVGTVAYMSPEQTYSAEIDHRSDIWSLGVVLYEMVTGMTPFRGQYDKAVMYAITEEEPEPITALRAGVPLELDWIVGKALAKLPSDRYQSAGEFGIDLATLRKRLDSSKQGSGQRRTRTEDLPPIAPPLAGRKPEALAPRSTLLQWALPAALLALAAVVGVAAAWWFATRPPEPPAPYFRVTQVTYDSGLTFQPAISPDGTLIAFASDRSGEGNLDIWVKHMGGGEPIRLTRNPADDSQPSFSPDGSRIVFRSERDGGGIYLIPVLGGEPRLIVQKGRNPHVSPNGQWITYWVGQTSSSFTGRIFIVETRGGAPRPLRAEFAIARNPIWLPDSQHLLFVGVDDQGRDGWWITPLEGGPAARAPMGEGRFPQAFPDVPYPAAMAGNAVLFSTEWGTSFNIWRAPLLANPWRTAGSAERVTAGAGREEFPSASGSGRLVFANLNQNVDVWALPFDPNQASIKGPLTRLTSRASQDQSPTLTPDGQTLVYDSNRAGNRDIWLIDRRTGLETALTSAAWSEGLPQITPDGAKLAYRVTQDSRQSVTVRNLADGTARTVCEDCSGPYGWLPDGSGLLARPDADTHNISLYELAGGGAQTLLKHPEFVLYEARFSPDGRWIAFHVLSSPTTRQMFVAPFHGRQQAPLEEWVAISDGSEMDRNLTWSPDGATLYFLSERDGFRCIWAQRLDRATKRPAGAPFNIAHFHQASRSMVDAGFNMSVTSDSLVFALTDMSGNVWMVEPEATPENPR
jgi:Tol biopolymer transport system component/predicted Ser/Thr protein kinase